MSVYSDNKSWRRCAETVITASMVSAELGAKALNNYASKLHGEWDLAVNNVRSLKAEMVAGMCKSRRTNPDTCLAAVEASIKASRAGLHVR